jgi:hypothetical protein
MILKALRIASRPKSIERDILVSAELYLMGDLTSGGSVEAWCNGETDGVWKHPGVLYPNVEPMRPHEAALPQ